MLSTKTNILKVLISNSKGKMIFCITLKKAPDGKMRKNEKGPGVLRTFHPLSYTITLSHKVYLTSIFTRKLSDPRG